MNLSPPPVYTSMDDFKSRSLSDIWTRWFGFLFNYLGLITDYTKSSVQTPLTGSSIALDGVNVLLLNPAGSLASLTITAPSKPTDGYILEISSSQIITTLTFSPSGTQTVLNAPTSLSAGSGFSYVYRQTTNTWYRRY